MYVYMSVCLCVRPIFWYFISRLLEEKSIQDTHRFIINSLNTKMTFKVQGRRDGTLLFEGTVISQKLSHRKHFNFFP